ncbi:RICIN domain-containing protein [Nocardia sp. N2S4-5]|uniref:RICIN domain-containing protein n=1 Tax=Nocardia sp. N2S4-5 TaxID=3351565 RepID=UPI0037D2A7E8
MLVRLLVAAGMIAALVTVSVPASAEPIRPGRYRVFWEPLPSTPILPQPTDVSLPRHGADDTLDVHQWEFVAIDYRPAGPVFQIRNAASRLCLRPGRLPADSAPARQDVCGISDTETWTVSPADGNYRLTLAADHRIALYGSATGASAPTALVGPVDNRSVARWILKPLSTRP